MLYIWYLFQRSKDYTFYIFTRDVRLKSFNKSPINFSLSLGIPSTIALSPTNVPEIPPKEPKNVRARVQECNINGYKILKK